MATAIIPSVRLAKPKGRPIQLRYTDRETGKEIRITTGVHDESEAETQKAALEAKLLLGIDAKPRKRAKGSASMNWTEFRERYAELRLAALRPKAADAAESRLDLAERILKPRTLADVADSESLAILQAKLLAGVENPRKRPRSKHSVKSRMAAVMAALNWAAGIGWLKAVPRYTPVDVAKLKKMKGRPITPVEFAVMLEATAEIVGETAAPSWRYLLRGAVESGLRLDELMQLSWDDPHQIMPVWEDGSEPVLSIPHELQKNDTEEAIPLVPGFEALLLETPPEARKGWVFKPASLQMKCKRLPRHGRPNSEWVGRVITRIGSKAGVIVEPAKGDRPAKYASSHDLRRMFANQLRSAGVPLDDVKAVIRHASTETTERYYAPAEVQRTSRSIRSRLGKAYLGTPVLAK